MQMWLKLVRIGVDVDFWHRNEERLGRGEKSLSLGASEWLAQENPELAKKLESEKASIRKDMEPLAFAIVRVYREQPDASEWRRSLEGVRAVFDQVDDALALTKLLLLGDQIAQYGADEVAHAVYAWAVDIAPSPQAQLETAYLIALRGQVQFPFAMHEQFAPPLLMDPPLLKMEGLTMEGHYEVIYDQLLDCSSVVEFLASQRMGLFRGALEGYGRVFCLYARTAATAPRESPEFDHATEMQPRVIDGIHVLIAAIEGEGRELLNLCFQCLFDWENSTGGDTSEVEGRLRICESSLDALEMGREQGRAEERAVYEAIRQLDEERRRTLVVPDGNKRFEQLEQAVARLGSVPRTTRAEIERGWASLVGGAWAKLDDGVRQLIIEGEWLKGVIEREDGSDYGAVALYYGRAIEALLCEITHSDRLLHHFGKMMTIQDANVLRFFRTGAPLEDLSSMVVNVARARNQAAHSNRGRYRRTDPGTIQELREMVGGSANRDGLISLLIQWRTN